MTFESPEVSIGKEDIKFKSSEIKEKIFNISEVAAKLFMKNEKGAKPEELED